MGGLGGLIGTAGGAAGSGFDSPTLANIDAPVSNTQIKTSYDQTQEGLKRQLDFVNAVNPGGQQALTSQQSLLGQLGQQAQGQGPNPALAQLNQATGQNVANQAALMAGQRGSGANTGLIARQAAQQGAATQQNSAGQAAIMKAQQQLAAQGQLQGLQGQMVGQQAGATNAYSQSAQNQQANLLNAKNAYNNAMVSNQAGVNNANASLAGIQMQGQQNILGNLMSGAGSVMSMGGAEGGQVSPQGFKRPMAEGGGIGEEYHVESNNGVQSTGPSSTGSPNIPAIENAFKSEKSGGGGGGGGGMSSMMGMAAMASDKNAKKNISSGKQNIEDMMSKIDPKSYEYKDPSGPGRAEGQRTGVIAQDLEKSKAGKSVVKDTSAGKMVDSSQAVGLALAGMADLHNRLAALEGGRQKYAMGDMVQQGMQQPQIQPMQDLAAVPMQQAGPMSNIGQYFHVGKSSGVAPGAAPSAGSPGMTSIQNFFKPKEEAKGDTYKPSNDKQDQMYANANTDIYGAGNIGTEHEMPANNQDELQAPQRNYVPDEGEGDVSIPMAAEGGKVPALLSPGERYLPPKEVDKVAKGEKSPMKAGEKIPGKPKVAGAKNSYANDTVPKTLEEGGIVLPRSVTQSKHPHWEAHKFVRALMAKNGKGLPKKSK